MYVCIYVYIGIYMFTSYFDNLMTDRLKCCISMNEMPNSKRDVVSSP